jgi:O-antigen ligase
MAQHQDKRGQKNIIFSGEDIREPLFGGILTVLLFALVYSPYLLSVTMFGIIALIFLEPGPKLRPGLGGLINAWHAIQRRPALLASATFFLVVLAGGLYSSEVGYWLERLRIKVPLLALPFALAVLPPLTRRQLGFLLSVWVLLLGVTSVGVGINYAMNFSHIQQLIKQGQSVPVPANHVRYSLMVATGVFAAIWLFKNRFILRWSIEPYITASIGGFLFLFMHLLAVRSGLVVFYLSLAVMAIRLAWLRRNWWLAFMPIVMMTVVPLVMYLTLPSFQAKVGYVLWDWKMYISGQGEGYSDSGRMLSLHAGWNIWMEHVWFGVGSGDLKEAVRLEYLRQFGETVKPIMPHNQWLSIAAGSGLTGLAITLIGFFTPLIYKRQYRNSLLLAIHLVFFLSFLVENTLENAEGVGLYTAFLCILLSYTSNLTPFELELENSGLAP